MRLKSLQLQKVICASAPELVVGTCLLYSGEIFEKYCPKEKQVDKKMHMCTYSSESC